MLAKVSRGPFGPPFMEAWLNCGCPVGAVFSSIRKLDPTIGAIAITTPPETALTPGTQRGTLCNDAPAMGDDGL
jgi:hypothetical protein